MYFTRQDHTMLLLYSALFLMVLGSHLIFLVNAKEIYFRMVNAFEQWNHDRNEKRQIKLESKFAPLWSDLMTTFSEYRVHFPNNPYTPIFTAQERSWVKEFFGLEQDFSFADSDSLKVFWNHRPDKRTKSKTRTSKSVNNGKPSTQTVIT